MRETSVEELMGQFKSIKKCAEQYNYEGLLDEDIDFATFTEWEAEPTDFTEWELDDLEDVDDA